MEIPKNILDGVSLAANVLTIVASSIAIFIFFVKKKEFSAAFKLLLNYTYQTTLTEIREKLERLNEYRVDEPTHVPQIKNILHEIAGQIRGNKRLLAASPELVKKIEALGNGKKLTEPSKRSLVSEIRETLKNLKVDSFEDLMGDK